MLKHSRIIIKKAVPKSGRRFSNVMRKKDLLIIGEKTNV
jgi:hypothetical protein